MNHLPGIVNYIAGGDPAGWHTSLPTYDSIVYRELYPGVDPRYQGTPGRPLRYNLADAGPRRADDGTVPVPLYSDLKRHDMGDRLREPLQGCGAGQATFITAALWGVGSRGPWLHDGRATSLSEAILWHGGEVQVARDRFAALTSDKEGALIAFLHSLVIQPPAGKLW